MRHSKGNIIVDDDVWIGYAATIMSWSSHRSRSSDCSQFISYKDVPPYAIVGGIPARVIKYRFEDDLIKELLNIDFNKLTKKKLNNILMTYMLI